MKEAMLYKKIENKAVECFLCHHRCVIKEGKTGFCKVRENKGGELFSLVYGRAISTHVDPIEKKPFFHFYPGSSAFSIAAVGCNFVCKFCQNYSISQIVRDHHTIPGDELSPESVINLAKRAGCKSISFTYTEPTIFFEYAYDISVLAKKIGIKTNFVSNGYMTPEAVDKIVTLLDAINVDLKAMSEKFYKEFCGAELNHVLETLKYIVSKGIWIEITTLLIPGFNDDESELKKTAEFICSLNPGIPWHVSRYHPDYKFDSAPPTPAKILQKAVEIGKKAGLRYIYTGNIPGHEGENTFCYNCGKKLISRFGFSVYENHIKQSKCPWCAAHIDGVSIGE